MSPNTYHIKIKDVEHSIRVQKYLFSIGLRWTDGRSDIGYTSKPFLYADMNEKQVMFGESTLFSTDYNELVIK